MSEIQKSEPNLSNKRWKAFCDRYLSNGMNGTEAYCYAYNKSSSVKSEYDTARANAPRLLANASISDYLAFHTRQLAMDRDQWIARQNAIATFDISLFLKREGNSYYVDLDLMIADGYGWMIRNVKTTQHGQEFSFADQDHAMDNIGKALGVFKGMGENNTEVNVSITDDLLARKIARVREQLKSAD